LFTVNDEDGVRDVDYEYLYKEERVPNPRYVTAERITTEETEPYQTATTPSGSIALLLQNDDSAIGIVRHGRDP
jgi:hypothetical protein